MINSLISIDDPQYMRWWRANPIGDHQSWAKKYNEEWEDFLDSPQNDTSFQGIINFGKKMLIDYKIID